MMNTNSMPHRLCFLIPALCALLCAGGCDLPLQVTITSPQAGSTLDWGDSVTLTGTVVDDEGSVPQGLKLTWSSDRDGVLGNGTSLVISSLSVGAHTITLTALAADNSTGTDRIRLTVNQRTGLIIRDSDFVGRDFRDTMWASATVRDKAGSFVTGLSLSDFTLTEAVIAKADGAVKVETRVDINDFIGDEWSEGGFWEDSRGGEPIDIVVAFDATGTMNEYVQAAKQELVALVSDLKAGNVDFRMAAVRFDETTIDDRFAFYGPQETDLLVEQIEYWLRTGTEWWGPTTAYDAVMFSPWFGFREHARKVCLVLTDIVPQTVYGTFWYGGGCTAATRSAVELFLKQTGIEIFYSQRMGYKSVDFHTYTDPDINPRASDNESGFKALAGLDGTPLATALEWPFSRKDFMETLGISKPQTVTDSRYLFAWESSFSEWEDENGTTLLNAADEYELRLTLQTADPDSAGSTLSATCPYAVEKQWDKTAVTLKVGDEEGTRIDSDLWGYVYHLMDERRIELKSQLSPKDGTIEVTYLPLDSTYEVFIRDGGNWSYTYHSIRAVHRETIKATQDGMSFDMQVETADKSAAFCKARGLLKDIADWQGIGDPFQDMVDDSRVWLDTLESDGVSWRDIEKVKRFYMALSGYANIIYYSQRQAEGAISDFSAIVQNFRDIVDQVEKIQETTTEEWLRELASILIEVVDVLITHGEFTAQKELLDAALDKLFVYLIEKLTTDLRKKIIEQFPAGDYTELLVTIVNYLIDAAFGGESSEPDWDGVYEALKAITLDKALETVKQEATDYLIDAALDRALRVNFFDDQVTGTVKRLVRDIIDALMSDDMEQGFETSFESFGEGMKDSVLSYGNETITNAIDTVFDTVDDELAKEGVPLDVREFLVGMARDLTRLAVPAIKGEDVSYHLDTDAVVDILIKYGVYYVILKDFFIDEISSGLDRALYEAQNFVPTGEDRYDWSKSMESDFRNYRKLVDGVQGEAWDSLRVQEAISEWAEQMQELCELLEEISAPLDFFANFWPDLKDTADDVHAFIAVLDGFQILPNSISFGLKVDCLDTFGNKAEPLYKAAFYPE